MGQGPSSQGALALNVETGTDEKHANTPKGCSRGMNTERGKAAQGLQPVLKKESITYLSAALSTHTHEEEAPWLCRTPAIDAIGAQMPFICHQLLWVLDNYPFILRLALGLLGATFWKCLGYSALLISDPQSISDWSYKVQKADPLPQERNTLI